LIIVAFFGRGDRLTVVAFAVWCLTVHHEPEFHGIGPKLDSQQTAEEEEVGERHEAVHSELPSRE
jgi:hypothetical protein